MSELARSRTVLAVPGSSPKMIAKGLASQADAVFLDLEDAVAPAEKQAAREIVANALRNEDWRGRRRTVRVNALSTGFCYDDLVWLLSQAGDALDALLLPKIDNAGQVKAIAQLLGLYERSVSRARPIVLEIQIETAAGLVHAEEIAACDDRVVSLVYGPGDFAASAGIPASNIATFDEWDMAYGGHRWHYTMSRIQLAAHAAGRRAIDGPYADFRDPTALRRSAKMARALGFDGKWCIHPAQIDIVNEIFTPSPDDIARAERIVDAYQHALREGRGAVSLDGEMLDAASIRVAERTLADAGLRRDPAP